MWQPGEGNSGNEQQEVEVMDKKITAKLLMSVLSEEHVLRLAHSMLNKGMIQPWHLQDSGEEDDDLTVDEFASQPALPTQCEMLQQHVIPETYDPSQFHHSSTEFHPSSAEHHHTLQWQQSAPEQYDLSQFHHQHLPPGLHMQSDVLSPPAWPVHYVSLDQCVPPQGVANQADTTGVDMKSYQQIVPPGPVADSTEHSTDAGTDSVEDLECTPTLMVRNLPTGTNQQRARAWIDAIGFLGKYDFFLWFPSKESRKFTHHSNGYCFINFVSLSDAHLFRKSFQGYKFSDDDGLGNKQGLSITPANLQGFAANYARFKHFLEPQTKTHCEPFFAESSIRELSDAQQSKIKPPTTTIVIRNLPSKLNTQDLGMIWFNEAGFKDQYDFFFLLPRVKKPSQNIDRTTHIFINFEKPQDAEYCVTSLNGNTIGDEGPLDVVYSRVQGLQACVNHFQTCLEGTKTKFAPWVRKDSLQGLKQHNPAEI